MSFTSHMRHFGPLVTAVTVALAVVACGGTGDPRQSAQAPAADAAPLPTVEATIGATPAATPATSSAPPPSAPADDTPRIALPVADDATAEGLVDVGGHDIYARCAGSGSPTVVYFTGWAPDRAKRGVDIGKLLERAFGPAMRVCSYERRNTGRSEQVEGSQEPEDLIADVDGMLEAMGEDGPFVLLGASFGGLVASAYAVAHPERVRGVLLLDASTGAEYDIAELEDMRGMCEQANRDADATESLEKIDNCALAKWVRDRRDREPDVPLLYLRSNDPAEQAPEAHEAVRKAWVEGWTPGTWRVVSAPHGMDQASIWLVAGAMHEILDLSR